MTDAPERIVAAVTPKVKPLAWFCELATKDHEMYESDCGEYSICDMRPFGGEGFLLCRGEMPIGTWQSLEKAKSAAQADHEPRILEALEPRPDAGAALDRALEQAREEGRLEEREAWRSVVGEVLAFRAQVAHGSVNLTALALAITNAENALRARWDHPLKSPDKPISGDI